MQPVIEQKLGLGWSSSPEVFPLSQSEFNFWCSLYWILGNYWHKRKRGNRIIYRTFSRYKKCIFLGVGNTGAEASGVVAGVILNPGLKDTPDWVGALEALWWSGTYRCQGFLRAPIGHLNCSDCSNVNWIVNKISLRKTKFSTYILRLESEQLSTCHLH